MADSKTSYTTTVSKVKKHLNQVKFFQGNLAVVNLEHLSTKIVGQVSTSTMLLTNLLQERVPMKMVEK